MEFLQWVLILGALAMSVLAFLTAYAAWIVCGVIMSTMPKEWVDRVRRNANNYHVPGRLIQKVEDNPNA